MVDIILERIGGDRIRVTAKMSGRTLEYVDADSNMARETVIAVRSRNAWMHRIGDAFSGEFVKLNDAASKAIAD